MTADPDKKTNRQIWALATARKWLDGAIDKVSRKGYHGEISLTLKSHDGVISHVLEKGERTELPPK